MNDARGRPKLALRTPEVQGVTVADSRGWLTVVPGSPVILFHASVCVGSASLGLLFFRPCPVPVSRKRIPSGIRGDPFFSLSCRRTGRTRSAFHSAAQLSERIGPRCLWSISPFLSFSSSSLPSHSPKLTTHTFASLLVQTTLARPPRLPLVSTCCFCDFFWPVRNQRFSRVNRPPPPPCDPAALCCLLSALEHHQLRSGCAAIEKGDPKELTRARAPILERLVSLSVATRHQFAESSASSSPAAIVSQMAGREDQDRDAEQGLVAPEEKPQVQQHAGPSVHPLFFIA